jgi:SAM-dependent methyltransferase
MTAKSWKAYIDYWNQFYEEHERMEPSQFAEVAIERIDDNARILDLGCGDGRDSVYFHDMGHSITGVDISASSIEQLRQLELRNSTFRREDFSQLDGDIEFDVAYSRFSLHAVDKTAQQETLQWCYEQLPPGGQLFIEVRSVNDDLFGKGKQVGPDAFVTDHYRCFVDSKALRNQLRAIGFDIDYFTESRGLSPFKGSDPVLIRLVAKR